MKLFNSSYIVFLLDSNDVTDKYHAILHFFSDKLGFLLLLLLLKTR